MLLTDLVTLELVRFGVRTLRRGASRLVRFVFRLALLAVLALAALWFIRRDLLPGWLRAALPTQGASQFFKEP